jgi:hypothetical protein
MTCTPHSLPYMLDNGDFAVVDFPTHHCPWKRLLFLSSVSCCIIYDIHKQRCPFFAQDMLDFLVSITTFHSYKIIKKELHSNEEIIKLTHEIHIQ